MNLTHWTDVLWIPWRQSACLSHFLISGAKQSIWQQRCLQDCCWMKRIARWSTLLNSMVCVRSQGGRRAERSWHYHLMRLGKGFWTRGKMIKIKGDWREGSVGIMISYLACLNRGAYPRKRIGGKKISASICLLNYDLPSGEGEATHLICEHGWRNGMWADEQTFFFPNVLNAECALSPLPSCVHSLFLPRV